jgi:hypothetical protein
MAAAGLLVRSRGELAFLPASIIRAIRHDVVVTPYPNSELGMALVAGRVMPVLSMGDDGRALIVCDVEGELIGISGLEPIQSGFLDGDERGPVQDGVLIPTLRILEHLEQWRAHR